MQNRRRAKNEPFNALGLLVWWQEGHPVHKTVSAPTISKGSLFGDVA